MQNKCSPALAIRKISIFFFFHASSAYRQVFCWRIRHSERNILFQFHRHKHKNAFPSWPEICSNCREQSRSDLNMPSKKKQSTNLAARMFYLPTPRNLSTVKLMMSNTSSECNPMSSADEVKRSSTHLFAVTSLDNITKWKITNFQLYPEIVPCVKRFPGLPTEILSRPDSVLYH